MATTVTWSALGTRSSNFASTSLDSLANFGTSTVVTYDNSTDKALYAMVEIQLGSFTSVSPAAISLRTYATANAGAVVPDTTGGAIAGDVYQIPITAGASAKVIVIPMVRLYPVSMRIQVSNFAGAAFAASGNSIIFTPFNETAT